jgi:hypothetical protein
MPDPFGKDAKAWRDERDKSDPIDWTKEPQPNNDRTAGGELPERWWAMNEAQIGAWLEEKYAAIVAATTFWAIHYDLIHDGLAALVRRQNDIARMSDHQIREMIAALEKARASKAVIDAFRELTDVRRH